MSDVCYYWILKMMGLKMMMNLIFNLLSMMNFIVITVVTLSLLRRRSWMMG